MFSVGARAPGAEEVLAGVGPGGDGDSISFCSLNPELGAGEALFGAEDGATLLCIWSRITTGSLKPPKLNNQSLLLP